MPKYRGHSVEYIPGGRYGDWMVHTYGIYGYHWFRTCVEAVAFIDSVYEA